MMMSHKFFGFGNEKGEHDESRAVVKQTLTHEQLLVDGVKLQCVVDAVNFLRETRSHGAPSIFRLAKKQVVRRTFWEVKAGDVNQSKKWECKPITES